MSETFEQWMEELLRSDAAGDKMTEKQARILQAAIEVFAEKGYAGSSTSEIAQRAGVAEGTIFRHYKTKKDLLLSIVAPAMAKLIAPFLLRDINKVLEAEFESYDDFLRALIANRIEFMRKHRNVIKIMIQEIPFHPELQEQFRKNVLAQVIERLTRIVGHFQEKGLLIELPPLTVIRLTASSVLGYAVARSLLGEREGSQWDDDKEREETIAFIMRGLGTGGPPAT